MRDKMMSTEEALMMSEALVEIVGFDATAQTVTVQFAYPIINDGFVVGQAAELRWIVSPNAAGKGTLDPLDPLDLLKAVHDYLEAAMIGPHPDAPGHCHHVHGRWDADGSHCEWCATWDRVRECVQQNARTTVQADVRLSRRVHEALEAASQALSDLGACDDPECRDENCNHALTKVRDVLANTEAERR